MKKDYTLYVISRIVKGRRDYLVDGLRTFNNKITKAKFFDSKKDAKLWLRAELSCDLLSKKQDEWAGRKSIDPLPTYELLSVAMKITPTTNADEKIK